jgi:hypothetical protein
LGEAGAGGAGALYGADADGIVRHGVFEGLREDNPSQEVTMECPAERSELSSAW